MVLEKDIKYERLPELSPLHMGRRTPSYSPPPRRVYGRRGRSPSPRGHYDSRARDLPTSLLVRNICRDCRPEDLRQPFGRFGSLKDIYLPRDYYTGEPRGFGFVQYMDPVDAAEAKYYMDRQMFHGREITVVFAEERRKKPDDMRRREIIRHRVDYVRHYSPGDDVRSHLRSQSPVYYSPHREPFSRSYSPDDRRYRVSQDDTFEKSVPS
ncbi:hypothetical protein SUGI_0007660 [Cryptomeria japonica]|nr:hypothetical protein SUGI_0007660 [Cryptomeria japonica]